MKRISLLGSILGGALVIAGIVAGIWWFSPAQQQNRRHQALVAACIRGDATSVQKALAEGADVNARLEYGITPLMYAARGDRPNDNGIEATDHPDVAELLIRNGAEVNARTDDGMTAIFWAARYGHHRVAKVLIDHGADVGLKDSNGQGLLPIQWALTNRDEAPGEFDSVIALLKEAEAKGEPHNDAVFLPTLSKLKIWFSCNHPPGRSPQVETKSDVDRQQVHHTIAFTDLAGTTRKVEVDLDHFHLVIIEHLSSSVRRQDYGDLKEGDSVEIDSTQIENASSGAAKVIINQKERKPLKTS